MKYLVKCKLNEESIKNLKYFEIQNIKNNKNLKNKSNFYIPILEFNCENFSKIKHILPSNFQSLQTFRVIISNIKITSNKSIYLLIERLGFLCTIQRIFIKELDENNIISEPIEKWNSFYIDYLSITNKASINLDNITFPNYVKISSIDIFKVCSQKNILVESIKLKNI